MVPGPTSAGIDNCDIQARSVSPYHVRVPPDPQTPAAPRVRPWAVVATVAALLAMGAAVAFQVSATLGLSFAPADPPREDPAAATPRAAAPAPSITTIVAPDTLPIRLAARAVADALAARGERRPAIVTDPAAPRGTALRVEVETEAGETPGPPPEAAPPERPEERAEEGPERPDGPSGEAYRLARIGDDLVVRAARPAGAATGLYALADRIRTGADALPAGHDGEDTAPRLGLRLLDTGSVGLPDDSAGYAAGDDYSLNSDVVGSALLAGPPYVDGAAVARIERQFRRLVEHALAGGYNGVVVPGFLEYVTFAAVGDGHRVYPAGDDHVARAEAMVAAFGPVWRYAHDAGMKVYFATDMLALSPPLERYLQRRFGGLATDDPRLWEVYQAGLRELFTALPYADGLVVRVGEGGEIYRFPGWDYTSQIAVKTPVAMRTMLRALLAVAGEGDRDIVLRTWTVGVGTIGDLHTNPRRYEQVLGDLDDPHLIVSTKYSLGDYYSHLPLNGTLKVGAHRRIVEFQARREFEGFGALPNDLTTLHQRALRELLAANPRIEGIWTWSQMGGPLRAGPRNLYLRTGFWQLYDVNVYTTARLAADPDADPARLTEDWIRRMLSTDPPTVRAIGEVLALSRPAITKGLYIGPYAGRTVKALGLEPPPMMWIFEWDIVTGDSAVLDSIYAVSRDRLDEAIREGAEASALPRRMRDRLAATDPTAWHDPAHRTSFVNALNYQVNLFDTLGAYRTMVLRHAQWLDTGSADARTRWREARARYLSARDAHLRRYTGDVELPPYRFAAADIGLTRAERDPAMAWLARGLLAALVVALVLGTPPGQRLLRALARGRRRSGGRAPGGAATAGGDDVGAGGLSGDKPGAAGPPDLTGSPDAVSPPGAAALRALWVGTVVPWRVGDLDPPRTTADRVLVWALPAIVLIVSRACYSWFASPIHVAVTLGGWAAFAGVLLALCRGPARFGLCAAVGGAALARTLLLLGVLAWHGPGGYWFGFWTQPQARSIYLTVAFAAFLWVPVAAVLALRALGARLTVAPVLAAAGATVALLGVTLWTAGLESALAAWNDQMALLPWGMHRILGITVFLEIPLWLPELITGVGVALVAVAGVARAGRWRGRGAYRPRQA